MELSLDLLPVVLLTDDELFALCVAHPLMSIERESNGNLIIMTPAGGGTSSRKSNLVFELMSWNRLHQGGVVTGPDGGFRLPNGAMRAPDAAWTRRVRWKGLSDEEREKFPPLCPDFIIELRSPSDRRAALDAKMEEWTANGCRLAWLIDPVEREAVVYRADGSTEALGFDVVLSGEDVLPGFELDVRILC
ncbi:MAG: Uma2 family endonuclease [Rhodothermales bacterium]